jgi:hypothetical protein
LAAVGDGRRRSAQRQPYDSETGLRRRDEALRVGLARRVNGERTGRLGSRHAALAYIFAQTPTCRASAAYPAVPDRARKSAGAAPDVTAEPLGATIYSPTASPRIARMPASVATRRCTPATWSGVNNLTGSSARSAQHGQVGGAVTPGHGRDQR